MPGHSQHEQFCRQDSDCLEDGDSCHGRVCTNLTTVTCRVIVEVFGAGGRFGDKPRMHGWLNNRDMVLQCWIVKPHPSDHTGDRLGYTMLYFNKPGVYLDIFSTDHSRDWNWDKQYSILGMADKIRHSNNQSSHYDIYIKQHITGWAWRHLLSYTSSGEEPVIAKEPREVTSWGICFDYICLPSPAYSPSKLYEPQQPGRTLLSINAEAAEAQSTRGALARTDGDIDSDIRVYIREY